MQGKSGTRVRGVRALPCRHVIPRLATEADLPAIWALVRPIYDEPRFNDTQKGFHLWRVGRFYDRFPAVVQEEFWGHDRNRRFAVVLEAKRSGRIVGVGIVIKPEGADEATGEISKVYLAPEYRGLGLGRWTMEVLLREARKLGFQTLTLMTRFEFEDAVALYKRLDFVQVPNTKYPGVKQSIAMERR